MLLHINNTQYVFFGFCEKKSFDILDYLSIQLN